MLKSIKKQQVLFTLTFFVFTINLKEWANITNSSSTKHYVYYILNSIRKLILARVQLCLMFYNYKRGCIVVG